MKEKDLQKLVDSALALHREIAEKSEHLKHLKTHLVEQARMNPQSLVATESGGKRWTAKGTGAAIARVSFPAPGVLAEIEPDSEALKKIQAITGDNFRRLFASVRIFQPVKNFRGRVATLLPEAKVRALLEICQSEVAPRVSFEVAKSAKEGAR